MQRIGHHSKPGVWLASAAAALMAVAAAPVQAGEARHFDAVVRMNGVAAGAYFEDTREVHGQLTDTVKQTLVLNRLGSPVSIDETDVYDQAQSGELLGGRFQTSSSKDVVTTELVVKDHALVLSNQSGGKTYTHSIPFQGEVIGPEGVRRQMRRIRTGPRTAAFQTFVSVLGRLAKTTLTYRGIETTTVEGKPVRTFKYDEAFEGLPGVTTFWTDPQGYTVKASQDSPFGPVEFVRGRADASVLAVGADLPAEVYERTIAISNIRIPHARLLDAVTLEITKKPDAEDGWPNLASANQKVISQTPRRIVLQILRPGVDGAVDTSAPTPDELAPNTLVQSDLPEIRKAALEAVGDETDPWKAALTLQTWTSRHMTFDAGIAAAPASELIRDRHGTCLGYSILLASLARADGIPSRIRLGSVYLEKMWGGHAWVEVYTHGRWSPLDSTIYYPGVADPARFGATTQTGVGGVLGAGDLAQLYGKIEVRTLGYRLAGSKVEVATGDPDHGVSGDVYQNRWLGLHVAKPEGMAFADLDAHWPTNLVLSMKGTAGTISIRQDTGASDTPLADRLRYLLGQAGAGVQPDDLRPAMWNSVPAVRLDTPDMALIAAQKDDQLWVVSASGREARVLLDKALPGIVIDDLKG